MKDNADLAGPTADFESWFAAQKINSCTSLRDRQECKQGLIYEVFRRHPEVLRAKRQEFAMRLSSSNRSDYRVSSWLNSPWKFHAFTVWEKPWNKLTEDERKPLISWVAAGADGPAGVSMSVSELLPVGESEVCKYLVPSEREEGLGPEIRVPCADELERRGWKVFAIDCRSGDSVDRAAAFIIKNHASSGGHGNLKLESWGKALLKWNAQFAGNFTGPRPVQITEELFREMETAWAKLKLERYAPRLEDSA